MATESSGPETAEQAGGRMIHDKGSDFQVPLPLFSGRNEDWPIWSASFGAYAAMAGWSTVPEVAANIVDLDGPYGWRSVDTLACGIRWVIWSATWDHGTRRGVPKRTVAGEC